MCAPMTTETERQHSTLDAMDGRMRVLIADDHPVVRAGLKQILLSEEDVTLVGEASSTAEVLDLARRTDTDLVILDLTMPGASGLEVLRQLKRERPTVPVLVLSVHAENQFTHQVLKAGASGYLCKDSAPDQLVAAVRKVVGGGRYVSPVLAERLAEDLDRDSDRLPHERLSPREFAVMIMLASGQGVSDIARELSLSVNAISTYRARVFEKLCLKNVAELIRYALENGLVE
jgi:two-component system invasion response regulator UvrY